MGEHTSGKTDSRKTRKEELIEQYGQERAEKIIRGEEDSAATDFHQPPDQGVSPASANKAMREPQRREQTDTPNPAQPDADRAATEKRKQAEDAVRKAKNAREEQG